MKFVVPLALLALLFGCNKRSESAHAPAALAPQEVQWNQTGAPAQPAIAVGQIAVNPAVVHSGQPATVSVKLTNVKPGTDITLSWFGPDGWNVLDQHVVASSDTLTFQVPVQSFTTPGRYEAELLNDVQLLGTAQLTVQ